MFIHFSQKSNKNTTLTTTTLVCSGRGKSYCLIHRRYFETSWCPDCSRSSHH
ncbi:MAG: hypothetical protein EXX96DRAFT_583044 [Benjaminiella poitrasii]|nr:MAG: hypothetical protein EXX96DRAFT_583044 [Benjaminiella poitrasii]